MYSNFSIFQALHCNFSIEASIDKIQHAHLQFYEKIV